MKTYTYTVYTCIVSLILTILFYKTGVKLGTIIFSHIFGITAAIVGLWSGFKTKA